MRVTRRQAILAATAAAVTVYGKEVDGKQRTMMIPLDGIAGIEIRYQGRTAFVRSDEIMAALSGKEA